MVAAAQPPVRFFSAEAPVVDLYLGQLDQVRFKDRDAFSFSKHFNCKSQSLAVIHSRSHFKTRKAELKSRAAIKARTCLNINIFSPGGETEECGRGVSHLLLCSLVRSLDGCPTGSAAGC